MRDALDVDAVEIVHDEHVLAFSGSGKDHHRPGLPFRTLLVGRTLREGRPIWARGSRAVGCVVPHCPLTSGFAVPITNVNHGRLVVALFSARRQPLSATARRTALGLALVWETLRRGQRADQTA